jgi:ABC-type branched-subunit amino acid transport system ATPase component
MCVLRVEGLTAGYGKIPVISDVAVRARVRQVVAIVGPNGAGKSTAMKAMFGLIGRAAGRVFLDEEDISRLRAFEVARAGLAYVPQVDNVFPSMTIEENLELGRIVRSRDLSDRLAEVFDIFPDLAAAKRRKAGQLSGGQRNMLGMARALMSDPKVVLLDEPTAGLSPANVDVVWSQVRRIAELGTSVVVVEQNVDRAMRSADWVYILVAGRNHESGAPAALAGLDLAAIFLGASGGSPGGSPGTPAGLGGPDAGAAADTTRFAP